MHILPLAPPHLPDNVHPSTAVRTLNQAFNAHMRELSGSDDFAVPIAQDLNNLRPVPQRTLIVLAAVQDPQGHTTLPSQEDETDLGFRGFATLRFPHVDTPEVAHASFTFPSGFDGPTFSALWEEVITRCRADERTRLIVGSYCPAGGLETDPLCQALRAKGLRTAVEETASLLDLALSPQPQLPAGLTPVFFDDVEVPEELVDSFLEIMTISSQDVPSAAPSAEPWTRQRLADAAAHLGAAPGTLVNACLVDAAGIAAFSYARVPGPEEAARVAEQDLTVVHRRARGQGLGMTVKAALYEHLRQRFPDIARVSTFNATTNTQMLAINHKLGLEPKFTWASWEGDVDQQQA
ncbi:GNAT family N-acetyltransferase [Corynebacterium lizhenjunii]|uniref:GNAT family N-acetyltransferase n=1 Tax=Corynebacterium lizhenjunii TaxID=2709394 RepID=UPI0013EA47B4|nr:hypothetical protein [Corynebacterium lizhenjunii]